MPSGLRARHHGSEPQKANIIANPLIRQQMLLNTHCAGCGGVGRSGPCLPVVMETQEPAVCLREEGGFSQGIVNAS